MEHQTQTMAPLFQVENVSIAYKTKRGPLQAVKGASFSIGDQEAVALIGESGCGKTTLATSIVRALPNAASVTEGKMLFRQADGTCCNILDLRPKELRKILWEQISMVFQASQSSFNPVKRIKTQFIDTVKAHKRGASHEEIMERARELLRIVMLDPDKVLESYPHEISGGMKQRTLIALSLLLEPRLIILDEPTTALDLLTQEKILKLLNELKKQFGFSLLFITHDLGIVSELADSVVTMYAGRVVERAPVAEFFNHPRHPYSKGLINAIPRLTMDSSELYSIPGSPPDMIDAAPGCPFAPRCGHCVQKCREEMPPLESVGEGGHVCACWNPMMGGTENE